VNNKETKLVQSLHQTKSHQINGGINEIIIMCKTLAIIKVIAVILGLQMPFFAHFL